MSVLLNAISILLLLLTPLAYLPTLWTVESTNGISPTAILLLALAAQAQLVTMYFLWRCPPFKRDGNIVPKPPRFIDYINLAQIVVHWGCLLLLLYLTQNDTNTAKKVLAIHAGVVVFVVMITPAPSKDWLDLPFVSVMCLNQYIINPIISVTTAVAMYIQINTARESSGLSRSRVGLLAAVYALIAVSWLWRMKVPKNRFPCRYSWVAEEWYPLVGWTCVNYGLIAVGWVAVVFYTVPGNGEREAILGR